MTALEFYSSRQVDGRALLTTHPPDSFSEFHSHPGASWFAAYWIVRISKRLVLCADHVAAHPREGKKVDGPYPVRRFVNDDENIWKDQHGDYHIGRPTKEQLDAITQAGRPPARIEDQPTRTPGSAEVGTLDQQVL